jgi:hypothetical protein
MSERLFVIFVNKDVKISNNILLEQLIYFSLQRNSV